MDPALARELANASKKANGWRARRDDLIAQAHQEGGSLREIAVLAGLSNPGVLRIIRKAAQRTEPTEGNR